MLPQWLERFRIPDALSELAWDGIAPRMRAYLKTGIALAHFHYGAAESEAVSGRVDAHKGFKARVERRPADWALLFLPADCEAAARVCAAAVLPRLAGVENVAAICLGGEPRQQLLLSLELCGASDVYGLPGPGEGAALLAEMGAKVGARCRACFMHGAGGEESRAAAAKARIPALELEAKPRLLLLDEAGFDLEALLFCQGEAPCGNAAAHPYWDCAYAQTPRPDIKAGLWLAPGLEGFWLFANATLEFYFQSEASFSRLWRGASS